MSAKHLEILIDEFNKLPGIGRKSATRLAFYIMNSDEKTVEDFAKALRDCKTLVKKCQHIMLYNSQYIKINILLIL